MTVEFYIIRKHISNFYFYICLLFFLFFLIRFISLLNEYQDEENSSIDQSRQSKHIQNICNAVFEDRKGIQMRFIHILGIIDQDIIFIKVESFLSLSRNDIFHIGVWA